MNSEIRHGTPDLTLSFLDVIANGLGCLLVLFFLSTIVRTELDWPLTTATNSTAIESDQDPFVILVTPSLQGGRLPPFSDQQVPWRIDDDQQQQLTSGAQAGWGLDHAILILDRRPGPASVVRLYLPPGSEKVDCQWFTATSTGRASIMPIGPDSWVQVWPRPEDQR